MTLLLTSIALLLLGNLICWRGDLVARHVPRSSPQGERAIRVVCAGTAVNMVAALLFAVWFIDWLF